MQAILSFLVGVRKGFLYKGIQLDDKGWPYRSGGSGLPPFALSGMPLTTNVGSFDIILRSRTSELDVHSSVLALIYEPPPVSLVLLPC